MGTWRREDIGSKRRANKWKKGGGKGKREENGGRMANDQRRK